jgi:hypothetical protein
MSIIVSGLIYTALEIPGSYKRTCIWAMFGRDLNWSQGNFNIINSINVDLKNYWSFWLKTLSRCQSLCWISFGSNSRALCAWWRAAQTSSGPSISRKSRFTKHLDGTFDERVFFIPEMTGETSSSQIQERENAGEQSIRCQQNRRIKSKSWLSIPGHFSPSCVKARLVPNFALVADIIS